MHFTFLSRKLANNFLENCEKLRKNNEINLYLLFYDFIIHIFLFYKNINSIYMYIIHLLIRIIISYRRKALNSYQY